MVSSNAVSFMQDKNKVPLFSTGELNFLKMLHVKKTILLLYILCFCCFSIKAQYPQPLVDSSVDFVPKNWNHRQTIFDDKVDMDSLNSLNNFPLIASLIDIISEQRKTIEIYEENEKILTQTIELYRQVLKILKPDLEFKKLDTQ